ncbi:MAG: 16S rRNA (guanine(527)-N(7))-methyltransferase RsmG [bacterium]|nr:16S rRNA (guanine(527)-N(7))-methyltransferase RsmG [bacterium]
MQDVKIDIEYLKNLFIKGLIHLGIEPDEHKIYQFFTYLEILKEWNKKMNLTGIKNPEDIIIKHFLDSLTCTKIYRFFKGERVIDIGTGAGFPGIPVKVYFPEINLTLLEANKKKSDFLKYIKSALKLDRVEILWGRAEEYGRKAGYRNGYDVVLSRAVSELRILIELCLPLLRKEGVFIALKGKEIGEEIEKAENAISILGGKVVGVNKIILPFINQVRNLVIIEKEKCTPIRYPRGIGIPKKRPL